MSRAFWLFLTAVSISFFALNQLLDNPPAKGNRQEIEAPKLAEQLVEPSKKPAHLSGASPQFSAPIDSKNSIATKVDATAGPGVESSPSDGLPGSEAEESQDDTASDEPEVEEILPEEEPTEELLTEEELPGSEAEEPQDDTASDESEEEALSE